MERIEDGLTAGKAVIVRRANRERNRLALPTRALPSCKKSGTDIEAAASPMGTEVKLPMPRTASGRNRSACPLVLDTPPGSDW